MGLRTMKGAHPFITLDKGVEEPLPSEDHHMATISLLDGSLQLTIYHDQNSREYEDNICICFVEDSTEDEKLFKADEVSIFLTPEETGLLVLELNRALEAYRQPNS
ncbi:MAG: hypothetical protein R3C44_05985 [Chloroflexota bacterium]